MARTHPRCAPEFRRQMVELVRSGRSAGELAHEWRCCCLPEGRQFVCGAQSIRNWMSQVDPAEKRRQDEPGHARDFDEMSGAGSLPRWMLRATTERYAQYISRRNLIFAHRHLNCA